MQKLTLLSFLITLELLFLLFSILILPINITRLSSPKEVNIYEENQKITIEGKIIKETKSTINFDNNISALFRHPLGLLNQTIQAQGTITSYYGNKTIQIKKIKIKK